MREMNTLSNVKTRRGEAKPPSVRFAPDTIPEAKSSKTGVSVRYVPDENKSWYVLRASYGREEKASDFLVNDGTYTYIAQKFVEKIVNGNQKKFLQPLIPNIVFAYTTSTKAEEYVKKTPALVYLTYYYNHFALNQNRKNPPLTISCWEMENFIHATSNKSEHLMFVQAEQCHYKGGETVQVIDGPFTGVVGKVARVSGQQRVVVALSNIGLISTAYIPTAFLKVLE